MVQCSPVEGFEPALTWSCVSAEEAKALLASLAEAKKTPADSHLVAQTLVVLAVFGFVLNSLTVVVLARMRKQGIGPSTRLLFIFLECADTAQNASSGFIWCTDLANWNVSHSPAHPLAHAIAIGFEKSFLCVSNVLLACITLERCIDVTTPSFYVDKMSGTRYAWASLGAAGLLTAVFRWHRFVVWTAADVGNGTWALKRRQLSPLVQSYSLGSFFALDGLLILVVLTCTFGILFKLYKVSKAKSESLSSMAQSFALAVVGICAVYVVEEVFSVGLMLSVTLTSSHSVTTCSCPADFVAAAKAQRLWWFFLLTSPVITTIARSTNFFALLGTSASFKRALFDLCGRREPAELLVVANVVQVPVQ